MSRHTAELKWSLARNRLGLGATLDSRSEGGTAETWLNRQIEQSYRTPSLFRSLPGAGEILENNPRPGRKANQKQRRRYRAGLRRIYLQETALKLAHAVETQEPFLERLVIFWSNHFTVSTSNNVVTPLAGAFEREAIRPHVLGSFEDMLLTVTRHPAMQIYLDNFQSIGPNSRAGDRTGRGLNENLAREILELHTLGVDGGYTQTDVIALAKMLTGWGIVKPGKASKDGFRFFAQRHEPGPKTLLGKSYREDGETEAREALRDLAHHPSTARFVATKFARHFISDQPPQETVENLEKVFLETKGDLKALAQALIKEEAVWNKDIGKLRTPLEFTLATLRAAYPQVADSLRAAVDRLAEFDLDEADKPGALRKYVREEKRARRGLSYLRSLEMMGQYPFTAKSPKGWPDEEAPWLDPNSIVERVDWAFTLGRITRNAMDPVMIGDQLLGPTFTSETRRAVSRASSPSQGMALLLASPEFMRR